MNQRIFILSLLTLSISACSTQDNAKRASGGFEYEKISAVAKLSIPKDLRQPKYSQEYAINQDINKNGPVGKELDVRAPALVLPIAASTRVDPNSTKAEIWFDKVLEDENLADLILVALKEKLSSDNVDLTELDSKKHLYESTWFNKTQESGFWLWSDTNTVASMRFQFQLTIKPHGRSVALSTKLVEFKAKNGSTTMDVIDQQRAEVAMLNNIIGHVDYLYRKHKRENRMMRATQKIVSISENAKGEAAYLVELEKDYLWANLPSFFEKYGFVIDDLNESKNIYYVSFTKPDASFWDAIWGDNKPIVELTNAKYQFRLTSADKNTALTIYDEAGKALSDDILEKIFPVMEPGLSFRNAN
ncbi:MAG: hypothetical protein COB35_06525 [Gammaproteobacteria bacterium]|nr:MAG: hypothetical protein COB35_06525 [Gammaproteobacteria bacterium]